MFGEGDGRRAKEGMKEILIKRDIFGEKAPEIKEERLKIVSSLI